MDERRPGFLETTDDALLRGRLTLRQPRDGHRAGTDALLVAALAEPRDGDIVVDLGAGTGVVGLAVALRAPGARIVLVERDPALADLCRLNLRQNGCEERGTVVAADILGAPHGGLPARSADWVVTNPPFAEAGAGSRSPHPRRAQAHELPAGGFHAWIGVCADLLRARGQLALIQRADRLAACLGAMGRAFGSVRIRPVHPKAGRPAVRVLIGAVRGGRAPLVIEPPLILHGADGTFTPLAQRVHEGKALSAALMP